jgi:pyruvate dehydrogenase E1 component
MEAMPDAGERQLKNLVWIVDYNRQNLDGTRVFNEKAMSGTDADRMVKLAAANGWKTILIKHGKLREKLFQKPGGDEFKRVIDEEFTDFEFQALIEANRPDLTKEVLLKKSSKLKEFISKVGLEEVHKAMLNLAGHDLETLVEALHEAKNSHQPTLVVVYTIKGWGLECQAQSGNHSALPEEKELEAMANRIGASTQDPFAPFESGSDEAEYLESRISILKSGVSRIKSEVKERQEEWIKAARQMEWPKDLDITAIKFNPVAHTQWMWGQVAAKLDRLARGGENKKTTEPSANDKAWSQVSKYFLTMAPDVGSSTNTSPNMNGKLYGDIGQEDFEKTFDTKDEKAPDVIPVISEKAGHIRFEIAEGNCMSAAGSFGKFFHFVGIPFFPAMTIYDFFIKRAHDQFYYNLYWHSSFCTLGTPSGITLAPEGAQHSWKSDFQIPNCVTWEPCFAKEMEWIMADMLRRHFTRDNVEREANLIRCVTKGMVQKEMMERLKTQIRFQGKEESAILDEIREDVLAGGYTLVDYRGYEDYTPGDNVIHVFAMSALVAEALKASDLLKAKGIYANVYVVTNTDLLLGNYAYHNHFSHLKERLDINGNLYLKGSKDNLIVSHRGDFTALQGSRVPVLSVHDGEPGMLDNIGSIVGTKHRAMAVRKTSKSGTTADVFHYHGLDAESIAVAAEEVLAEATDEKIEIAKNLLT